MSDIKLITKDDCPKCEWVKEQIAKNDYDVEILNENTVLGMQFMAYYGLIQEGQVFPVLIQDDIEETTVGSININRVLKGHFTSKSI